MDKKTPKAVKSNLASDILEKPNMVHALAYIPYLIGPIVMFFLSKTDKKNLMHHIKYAVIIFAATILLMIILNDVFRTILNILYIVASGYLAWKAYNGEEVQIEILNSVEEKFNEKINKK